MEKTELILFLFFMLVAALYSAKADDIPRPEHPRPDLMREAWQNLNGEWRFQEDPYDQGEGLAWFNRSDLKETIKVPFEVESPLSGLGRENPSQVVWYLRDFDLSEALKGRRVILRFGAADHYTKVWLNGKLLGEHTGGYTPFGFDVTDELAAAGSNRLAVRVYDSKSTQQVRGKQTWKDAGFMIHYTATTGIWQTVWLEAVGDTYIERYETFPELSKGLVKFRVHAFRPEEDYRLSVKIKGPDGREVPGPGDAEIKTYRTELVWRVENPRLWSPEEPSLYELEFQIKEDDKVIDSVKSYCGLRTIEVRDGEVLLNGRPLYQKLLLVQGYYTPTAVYSPASDEVFRKDIEAAKLMGFNGARVHQKIEDPRYYYWCDRLGFLIWEEMPSMVFWKINGNPTPESRAQFQSEMREMIQRDFNHPSVIVWTIFNESWGLHDANWSKKARRWWIECVNLAHEQDPTRLVVDNSGWLHRKTDILDVHHYLPTAEKSIVFYEKLKEPWGTRSPITHSVINALRGIPVVSPLFRGTRYEGQPIIISEYGGFGFYKTEDKSLTDNYREYTEAIGRYDYIKGYCYTQQYDIEQEANGLQNEDRTFKVPPEEIKKINDSIRK